MKDEMPSSAEFLEALGKLTAVQVQYDAVREFASGLRARYGKDQEQAYWIGVAQAHSKRVADELAGLDNALYRLGLHIQLPKKGSST